MDPFKQKQSPARQTPQANSNPLARAMAETEQHAFTAPKPNNPNTALSEALARTGGQFPDTNSLSKGGENQFSAEDMRRQQEELLRQQKKEQARRKRHQEINPIDMKDVFDAKEQQVVKRLQQTRDELKMLIEDVKEAAHEYDIIATQTIVNQGTEGSGAINYWDQFLNFIKLLRQRVQSARTWMKQAQAKSKKKRSKKPGMEMGGQKHEQGKAAFDMMHHERSSSYSGN